MLPQSLPQSLPQPIMAGILSCNQCQTRVKLRDRPRSGPIKVRSIRMQIKDIDVRGQTIQIRSEISGAACNSCCSLAECGILG